VKNNLQTIAALLRLQARRRDAEVADQLRRASPNISIAVRTRVLSHEETSVINNPRVPSHPCRVRMGCRPQRPINSLAGSSRAFTLPAHSDSCA